MHEDFEPSNWLWNDRSSLPCLCEFETTREEGPGETVARRALFLFLTCCVPVILMNIDERSTLVLTLKLKFGRLFFLKKIHLELENVSMFVCLH